MRFTRTAAIALIDPGTEDCSVAFVQKPDRTKHCEPGSLCSFRVGVYANKIKGVSYSVIRPADSYSSSLFFGDDTAGKLHLNKTNSVQTLYRLYEAILMHSITFTTWLCFGFWSVGPVPVRVSYKWNFTRCLFQLGFYPVREETGGVLKLLASIIRTHHRYYMFAQNNTAIHQIVMKHFPHHGANGQNWRNHLSHHVSPGTMKVSIKYAIYAVVAGIRTDVMDRLYITLKSMEHIQNSIAVYLYAVTCFKVAPIKSVHAVCGRRCYF